MELEDLKSNWKKTGTGKKDQKELLIMTKIKNHSNIKRIRAKFLIETILIIGFLAVYYDGFDGALKPLWTNILLIGSTLAYIIFRVSGWLVLRNPIRGENLKKSLIRFQSKLNLMARLNLIISFLFGSAVILFFTLSIDFTMGKYFILAGMILSLMLLIYLSGINWFKRIESINATLKEFKSDSNEK
ncbi:MAG: hypothetical protein R3345_01215 [Fulvivirga sp.]|nr:hypothetical protein [Fulvivirga sp.]